MYFHQFQFYLKDNWKIRFVWHIVFKKNCHFSSFYGEHNYISYDSKKVTSGIHTNNFPFCRGITVKFNILVKYPDVHSETT